MKKISFFFFALFFIVGSRLSAFSENSPSPKEPARGGIPVLMYHEIVSDAFKKPGSTVVTLDEFSEQMKFLKENGYTVLGFDEFIEILRGRKASPEKAVVLTFDDGFQDALQAVPVLERYGFKASFWIIAGEEGIGAASYMDWKDVIALDHNPLFTIGSHSMSHPDMLSWIIGGTKGKGESNVRFELEESKRVLEQHLGHPIRYFCWPFGRNNKKLIQMAREAGYEALLTAWNGLNVPGEDIMKIHRTVVSGSNNLDVFSAQLKDGLHHFPQASNAELESASPQPGKN